jgi:hypothetical protein
MSAYQIVLAFCSILIACGLLMFGYWAWQKICPPKETLPPPEPDERNSIDRFNKSK